MKALYLTGDVTQVWPLLSETSFGDNGGEPDGNAWLNVDYDQGDADRVVAAGLGEITEVKVATIEAMAAQCGIRVLDLGEFGLDGGVVSFSDAWQELDSHAHNDILHDVIFPAVEDKTACWAYYGADQRFIFKER